MKAPHELGRTTMTCATMTCAAKYRVVALALLLSLIAARTHPENFAELRQAVQWGESRGALLAHFGGRVTVLPRPLDFGDSYGDVVLRDVTLGDVPMMAYSQMDKGRGGLNRIQFERPRHGLNPPVSRHPRGARGGLWKPRSDVRHPPGAGGRVSGRRRPHLGARRRRDP